MNPFAAIVEDSLVFSGAGYWSDSAINKPKAIRQRSPFSCNSIDIGLEVCRAKHIMNPLQNLVSMNVINIVNHLVCYHAQNWDRLGKSMNHISIPAWI